jgi:TonB family protein
MTSHQRKSCVRCNRQIDALAKNCLYCNWDQTATPPSKPKAQSAAAHYVPPPDNRARNKVLGIVGFAALLIIAFVVGSFVHGFESKEVKAAQPKAMNAENAPPAEPKPQASVTLVPVEEGAPTSTQQLPDSTAMMSQQLGAQPQPTSTTTQPQSRSAAVARTAPRPHTEPVPEYQPVPPIRVDRETTARLSLTIGRDGRVKDIDVLNSVAGETPRLINAVQNWRFRPATVSGQPVPSRFTVNITFHAS